MLAPEVCRKNHHSTFLCIRNYLRTATAFAVVFKNTLVADEFIQRFYCKAFPLSPAASIVVHLLIRFCRWLFLSLDLVEIQFDP